MKRQDPGTQGRLFMNGNDRDYARAAKATEFSGGF